jgi:indolepyruvate ferredoxin oxidoreductase alpha subunit
MSHPLLHDTRGSRHVLLGNEAIARGAIEAGVGCVTCYPGTPSSEIPDTLYRLAPHAEYYFEYSVNEKVALEVGGGAALGGVPTLVTMKHVGLNVAADPLMSLAYIGTPGGLVILSADDPGCHSSQNEQDNRYYARLAGLPCFEPYSAQEAKDMAREAFDLSRKWQQPVLLRTTTRLNHLRGQVVFDTATQAVSRADHVKHPQRFVPLPAIARARHPVLLQQLEDLGGEADRSRWNRVSGGGRTGVIASGMARAYLRDAMADLGLEEEPALLELGMSYPLPRGLIRDFVSGLDRVLILEELEPIVETEVRALCQELGLEARITGKGEDLSRMGEYATSGVRKALSRLMGLSVRENDPCQGERNLPGRPPNLCPGCPHRSVYYAVRKVFGDDAVYSSDIGCYTLGFQPPHRAADFLFCMGSSVSGGTGMSRATGRPVVAYIGDSTFFHSGVAGLINAVHNRHDLLLVILDNATTAMTGHQPHPGVETTPQGENTSRVDIESVVRGCGVNEVTTVKALNLKQTFAALRDFKEKSGVRVLIARDPCTLFARRTLGKAPRTAAYVAEQDEAARACLEELACPAFTQREGEIAVDEDQCAGCMVCVQIADSVKAAKRST